jgi:hypothetical protein
MGGHVVQDFHLAGFRVDFHFDPVDGEGIGFGNVALGSLR